MIGYVYSITSKSGKIYIGSTSHEPKIRWNYHSGALESGEHNSLFQQEFREQNNNWDNFNCKILTSLFIDEADKHQLYCIEGRIIRSIPSELSLNVEKFPELRKSSWGRSGIKRPAWNKGKQGTMLGKRHTSRAKQKMSESQKEHFKSTPNPFKNKTHTEQTRSLMRKRHVNVEGENNPASKLADDQRREIWYKFNVLGMKRVDLSREYLVNRQQIYKITCNKKWSNS